jgi:hypothetical protein
MTANLGRTNVHNGMLRRDAPEAGCRRACCFRRRAPRQKKRGGASPSPPLSSRSTFVDQESPDLTPLLATWLRPHCRLLEQVVREAGLDAIQTSLQRSQQSSALPCKLLEQAVREAGLDTIQTSLHRLTPTPLPRLDTIQTSLPQPRSNRLRFLCRLPEQAIREAGPDSTPD